MGQPANSVLDHGTMQILQDMVYRNHPAVQFYKQAYELTTQMPVGQDCRIALRFDQGADHRRYNLPTTTANEIAVILPGDGDQPEKTRDIILHRRGGGLREIDNLHPLYPSLHYVLLFPTGQLSWHTAIPYIEQEETELKQKNVTLANFLRYRLHPRTDQSNHIFMAGKLCQEYTVDSWATTEQHRLKYLSDNQTTIRAETYQGLTDAVAADPALNQHNVGQHIILPSTFSGSSRNMIQHCQDALAINHYFHGADFFAHLPFKGPSPH